jgi:NSS family neurotransmitter:Na+ symporter
MPAGHIISVLFFLLLSVAAITSMVGLIEPLTLWVEEHKGIARHKSAMAIIAVIGVLSMVSILGYTVLADVSMGGRDINGVMDYVANQLLLPVGGFLIALFVGWCVRRDTLMQELGLAGSAWFSLWYFLIRYLVPVAIFLVFLLGVSE